MSLLTREPLRDKVRRVLLDWLITGKLEPGSSISEPQIAEQLGISRTPLREALLKLEFEGFLKSEPGKGFSVRPLSPDTAEDLYRLVGTLEVEALRNAGLPDETLMDELDELDRRRRTSADDHEAVKALRLDQEWHTRLLEACGNRELQAALDLLKNRLYRYEYVFADDFERLGRTGLDQHRAIVDALRDRELDRACELLRDHWDMGAESRPDWLRKTERLSRLDGSESN